MIERENSLVQETGDYSELEAYTGHPIDERAVKVVIEYYINDHFIYIYIYIYIYKYNFLH